MKNGEVTIVNNTQPSFLLYFLSLPGKIPITSG